MSLAIDVDKVIAVLLADGWHAVALQVDKRSSFDLDSYEFIAPKADKDDGLNYLVLHGGGLSGICATGASWIDKHSRNRIACPLTAVLAVEERVEAGK